MRCIHALFILTACSGTHRASTVIDAAQSDGSPAVPDAGGAVTERDASMDASFFDATADTSAIDAPLDASGIPDAGNDAAAVPDAMPTATCTSTVTLSRAGGSGSATWTCPGTQLASWHLKIESRDGVLFNQLNGTPCPGGSAFISFTYNTSFTPLISINRLELADGTSVPCVAP
jgi:hypothetical protein